MNLYGRIIAAAFLAVQVLTAAELGSPLPQAHSHNDYEHARPLWDALKQGFASVEADIFLVNGQLLVAHDLKDVRPERTLERLYLEPLQSLVRQNNGRVYPSGQGILLLIDFKSEAETTYAALEPVLARFASMLTKFDHDRVGTNAVTVVLSGNRPRERLLAQKTRWAAFDGRLADLGQNLPVAFMPLVSDNFAERFPSIKTGQISEQDQRAFKQSVQRAHHEGRTIRFWATRDDRQTWEMLFTAGVDYINTDNLAGLAEFLHGRHAR